MTIFKLIDTLQKLAKTIPNVRSTSEGDIYRVLNNNPQVEYDVVHIMQNQHQHLEYIDRYNLTIFFVSRLDDTLEDNRLQCQSVGKEVLKTLITDFCDMYNLDFPTYTVQVFTEKFTDLCAGCYINVTIEIPTDACADDFSDIISIYQTKTIDIENNGQYIVLPDSSYSALEKVIVNVDVACSGCTEEELQEMYESGWTDGYSEGLADCTGSTGYDEGFEDGQAAQKALLSSITITQNGEYFQENGYSAITVNVPQSGGGDFQEGFESGVTYQKSLLTGTAFTKNGNYTSPENGWSAITIDVSGYTQEDLDNAYNSGITYQKSLLTSTAFTQNGTYSSPENGWSAVTVNVPTNIQYHRLTIDFSQSEGLTGLANNAVVTVTNSSGSTNYTYTGSTIIADLLPGLNYNVTYSNVSGYNTPSGSSITTVWSGSTTLYPIYTEIPQIVVTPSSSNVSYLDQTINIEVTSNTGWTITDYPSWATPNVLSGTGNATVVVSLTENTGTERTDTIEFTTVGSQVTASITQGIYSIDATPLTFEVVSAGTIYYITDWYIQPSDADNVTGLTIQYSKNGGELVSINPTRNGTAIQANVGDVIRFYGNNDSYSINSGFAHFTTKETTGQPEGCKFMAYGNVMSLIRKTNFNTLTSFPSSNANFYCLFRGCRFLMNHQTKDIILPATTLTRSCYEGMFGECSYIERAPELPCTTFNNNTINCYQSMFSYCVRLNYIKCLSLALTSTKVTSYSFDWVTGVAATGTFVKNPDLTNYTTSNNGIPSGWTIIDAS